MASYSISYVKRGSYEFAYVDSKMYTTVSSAVVRAILHMENSEDLGGAMIIYQGSKVQKRVRTIQYYNHDPKHK